MTFVWLLIGAAAGALLTGALLRRAPEPAPAATGLSAPADPAPDTASPSAPLTTQLIAAMDALTVGVVVSDATGEIVYRNRLARGLTGVLHADVLVDEAVETHLAAAADGQTRRQVLDLFGPPHTVVVVQAAPIEGNGAVATIEDITERSRLDAVRTDFVANVSHELKTPIGAIAVLAEALLDEDDPEIVKRFVPKMVAEAHRVGRTIDDLLELSRIELGGEAVRQGVDVDLVVADAVERVQSLAASRGIRIITDRPGGLTVLGDRRQLASALGNLVENAVKYSDDGSDVVVTSKVADDWVDFVVADTGVGIPTRDLDRVFERFYRVDRARSRETGGTGLGLAIVRHVATNHSGEVTVTSREGEGSVFTLRIPNIPLRIDAPDSTTADFDTPTRETTS